MHAAITYVRIGEKIKKRKIKKQNKTSTWQNVINF